MLMDNINESVGQNINARTHIVGFSLGAHVAGFAGNHLKNLSRITGITKSKIYNFFKKG